MNKKEYLLACLSEECAEVQKLVGKSLRFGSNNKWAGSGKGTNAEKIFREYIDIDAIVTMLLNEKVLMPIPYSNYVEQKLAKIDKTMRLMKYSKKTKNLR